MEYNKIELMQFLVNEAVFITNAKSVYTGEDLANSLNKSGRKTKSGEKFNKTFAYELIRDTYKWQKEINTIDRGAIVAMGFLNENGNHNWD